MPDYICEKCSTTFDKKSNYDRHLNKLIDCKTGNIVKNQTRNHICTKCKKGFDRKDSLKRHMTTCKFVKKKVKKKVTINKPKINGNNNINNINNINGNVNGEIKNITLKNENCNNNIYINLVVFTKDGIKNISPTDLSKILKSNTNLLESMITNVNLNPNKPYHHNIFYKDTKSSYGEVYENKTWVTKKIDQILNSLLDAKIEDLNEILNKMGNFLNKKTRNKIKDAIEKIDYKQVDARKKLRTYLKPILYNKRDMILKTKDLFIEQQKEVLRKQQENIDYDQELSEINELNELYKNKSKKKINYDSDSELDDELNE